MNVPKIIHWIATFVMCGMFAFSAWMYFTKYEMVQGFYDHLGFPGWMIYPLATAKVLGIIAILTSKVKVLKEWAYAGFFFDASMAIAAHQIADGAGSTMAIIALVATVISRFTDYR